MAQKLYVTALAAAGGLAAGLAVSQIGFAIAAGSPSNAGWAVDSAGLASAVCAEGTVMVGLHKTTSDATVSMDPAAYRDIVPVCAPK